MFLCWIIQLEWRDRPSRSPEGVKEIKMQIALFEYLIYLIDQVFSKNHTPFDSKSTNITDDCNHFVLSPFQFIIVIIVFTFSFAKLNNLKITLTFINYLDNLKCVFRGSFFFSSSYSLFI